LVKAISGPQLAEWLTSVGMQTSANDVKNASRKTLRYEEGVIPRSPEVLAALTLLQGRFPEADLANLLIPENLLIV
jgi:hypothetical protein